MFEAIAAFIETVCPRLGVCLLLGFVSAVGVLMTGLSWWKRIILAFTVFVGWGFVGIVLEVVARKKNGKRG